MSKTRPVFAGYVVLWLAATLGLRAQSLSPIQQLGKSIFVDQNLSINQNQACAACHAPEVGWTGPIGQINAGGAVYEGSIAGRFGNRKPPSSAYATPSPVLHFVMDKKDAVFIGGNFWDGRATGEGLGNPAADQALGPFLNPAEQALPDSACVVHRVCTAGGYPTTFEQVWGADACDIVWPADVDSVCGTEGGVVGLSPADRAKAGEDYQRIGLSIAAYEASSEVNAFSSKFDYFLARMVKLTRKERMGFNLFKGKGKCAKCHVFGPGPNGEPPLLTDFTYDNLGVPRNPDNPFYVSPSNPAGINWVDLGLGEFLSGRPDYAGYAEDNEGKQKVPTLRNVALRPNGSFVKAYGHNGYFKSLRGIVHFYNTRDVKPTCPDPFTREADALAAGCWPVAEVQDNVNTSELGNLHLTPDQEDAIVAFLETLSDGFPLPGP